MIEKNRPELTIERHPNGKMFIEIDSLIDWFKDESLGGDGCFCCFYP